MRLSSRVSKYEVMPFMSKRYESTKNSIPTGQSITSGSVLAWQVFFQKNIGMTPDGVHVDAASHNLRTYSWISGKTKVNVHFVRLDLAAVTSLCLQSRK